MATPAAVVVPDWITVQPAGIVGTVADAWPTSQIRTSPAAVVGTV